MMKLTTSALLISVFGAQCITARPLPLYKRQDDTGSISNDDGNSTDDSGVSIPGIAHFNQSTIDLILQLHNDFRQQHGITPNVSWDAGLAKDGASNAKWSGDLCSSMGAKPIHRTGNSHGENLAEAGSATSATPDAIHTLIGMWTSESVSEGFNHATQILSTSLKYIGCALYTQAGCGGMFACEYDHITGSTGGGGDGGGGDNGGSGGDSNGGVSGGGGGDPAGGSGGGAGGDVGGGGGSGGGSGNGDNTVSPPSSEPVGGGGPGGNAGNGDNTVPTTSGGLVGGGSLPINTTPEANGTVPAVNGTTLLANGTILCANGTIITANGTIIMANGTMITANGTMITANGTIIAVGGTPVALNGTDSANTGSANQTSITSTTSTTSPTTTTATSVATSSMDSSVLTTPTSLPVDNTVPASITLQTQSIVTQTSSSNKGDPFSSTTIAPNTATITQVPVPINPAQGTATLLQAPPSTGASQTVNTPMSSSSSVPSTAATLVALPSLGEVVHPLELSQRSLQAVLAYCSATIGAVH
ncbi:hypothetical protein RI367_006052 [Sorochytrium milnesiophthora]